MSPAPLSSRQRQAKGRPLTFKCLYTCQNALGWLEGSIPFNQPKTAELPIFCHLTVKADKIDTTVNTIQGQIPDYQDGRKQPKEAIGVRTYF